jgi:hypothetical protein
MPRGSGSHAARDPMQLRPCLCSLHSSMQYLLLGYSQPRLHQWSLYLEDSITRNYILQCRFSFSTMGDARISLPA